MHTHMHIRVLERGLLRTLNRFLCAKHKVSTKAKAALLVKAVCICEICLRLWADKQLIGHVRPW